MSAIIEVHRPSIVLPRVLNKRRDHIPATALCVDRSTALGNPFRIGRDGTRKEVIEKYRRWLPTQPNLMALIDELRGRDLVCWCAPLACHADVLIELANPECFAR